ncbi:unnamed protein product [Moneuplotes crassus]|uniref:Uncharacterized protein n=1 Tax=Euplotes crassus TaxID=5936 RepID=A0AAD1XY15_EUPCR|nr:unnamed protein product [Moneuplotes crassus]
MFATKLGKKGVGRTLFENLSKFSFSFEQHYQVPPRYFFVTLNYAKNIEEAKEELAEHNSNISKLLQDRKIMLKGTLAKENSGQLLIFSNCRDEIEPHSFVTKSPLFIGGFVKDYEIKELDLIHSDRDDEITLHKAYT